LNDKVTKIDVPIMVILSKFQIYKINSMKKVALLLAFLSISILQLIAQAKNVWQTQQSGGYIYKTVVGDPIKARFYTLKNGLTVILSPNKKEPRISFQIAVRAGSNTDPADHTGLAHYLEHMLFKGTDKFGTLNWNAEKPLLDKIDQLYSQYNQTTDPVKRKEIYKEIDRVSGEAAKFSIANEYDKMMASIGSQGTNAHTWYEETVYEEDIPANAIDKFLSVQAERFRNPILRIFHTELEAVYEEKNRGLDNDARKVNEIAWESVFPKHNYGQQTTIGTIEHLKNPSLVAIRNFYNTYYVPNNMALVLSGDMNPDEMIKKIDTQFGFMKTKPFQEYIGPKEDPIKGPIVKEVYGPSAESVQLFFRSSAVHSKEATLTNLLSKVLSNGKAGLMDLNLNKQQKVQSSRAGLTQVKDYGVVQLTATPKQGQTLDEAKSLILDQIAILKRGDFDESLIKAIAANEKLNMQQSLEENWYRVGELVDGYIKHKGKEWNQDVSFIEDINRITKKELVDFANQFFKDDNFVIVYKRKGEDKNIVKVDKPSITPVETNPDKQSSYVKNFIAQPQATIAPVWVDYTKQIQKATIGSNQVLYTPNTTNSIFRMYYRFSMGNWNSKTLGVALQYLQFLGDGKNSSEDFSKQFYNLACTYNANTGNDETTITLTGLQQNFDQSLALLEQLVRNCKPDESALTSLKNRIAKARANNKLNKGAIANALRSYATYGSENPFNFTLTDAELNAITAESLVQQLHTLFDYQHTILYYGPNTLLTVSASLKKIHPGASVPLSIPAPKVFKKTEQQKNQVLFANYDMVQAEIYWVRNLNKYNITEEPVMNSFNGFFGNIVFQTIRESKALAYSTYAFMQAPTKKEDQFSAEAYVGTQADKLNESIVSMNELLNVLPMNDQNFSNSMKSMFKDIETERISKDGILLSYLAAEKKGWNEDPRKTYYTTYQKLTPQDLIQYHSNNLSKKNYTYCIVASEKKVKEEDLAKYGEVKKLGLTELFGY
jgi:predicted Zn-dependent peptidase